MSECECRKCKPQEFLRPRMIVCKDCGCKRCPRAENHELECTGNNYTDHVHQWFKSIPDDGTYLCKCGAWK